MKATAINITAVSAMLLLGQVGCASRNTAAAPASTETLSAGSLPSGIDPAQTSLDATFGYTKENPVRLGSPAEFGGPAMSSVYLRHLRDHRFQPFAFSRDGSFGPAADGHIVDRYTLIDSEGKEHTLFVDMYHPENTPLRCKAPCGMYFWK